MTTSARRLARRPSDGEISKEEEEDEQDARKKEEAAAALGVFLESWLHRHFEDAAWKKKNEEEDARRKKEVAGDASEKDCFNRYYDFVVPNKLKKLIEEDKQMWEVKKEELDKMREWLMLLATLAVSIAYSSGLNPPGGLWQDNGDGHHAGTPVLQTTNRLRYLTFYYSNAMSFVMSLVIIALLLNRKVSVQALVFTAMFDLTSLVVAYLAGTTSDLLSSIALIVTASAAFIYFARGIMISVSLAALGALAWCLSSLCCIPCIACFFAYIIKGAMGDNLTETTTRSEQNHRRERV